jgi:small-conductance mechanosensitive channel
VRVPFTIAYGEDLSKASALVLKAVTALDAVYDDPEPVAYIYQLGSEGSEFRMRYYHADEGRVATRDEVAQTIVDTLLAACIKLGTPELIVCRREPEAGADDKQSERANRTIIEAFTARASEAPKACTLPLR